MTFAHEAVAALPVTPGLSDAALIRNLVTRRFAYVLAASESATNFVAADPASGVLPQMLFQNNISFLLDPLDSTTTHDGVTCLVSSDAKRFKAATIAPPYSVLTKGTVAQPGSPAVGDQYLIPAAATGTDWAGKDNQIGIYTAAGWRFAVSPIGRFLYVKDETAVYHRNAAGTWTAGVGSIVLGANSVPITAVLGAKASFVIKVENQTTNAPPVSPTAPTAYIIGSSPTGAWAGQAGKLAICLVAGAFTIITPAAGDEVYDKSLNIPVRFNGTAWLSAAGAIVGTGTVFTVSNTGASRSGAIYYGYSDAIAPTGALSGCYDQVNLTYTAKRAGNAAAGDYNLIFDYQARTQIANTSGVSDPKDIVAALYRDGATTALDWVVLEIPTITSATTPGLIRAHFEIDANDALSHAYHVTVLDVNANVTVQTLTRRRLSVMERA